MKKWMKLFCAAAAVFLLQNVHTGGVDVSMLEPVEAVKVEKCRKSYLISTDTGQSGRGTTLEEAVEDMRRTSDGRIFLDTAGYLLVDEKTANEIGKLGKLLRSSCRVCLAEKKAEISNAAGYLQVHKPEMTIRKYRISPKPLEKLFIRGGKMILEYP